ncbi:response regulator transcription factor [Bacillus sp. FJAT-27225]|uniref:response regulator transcription factor n=1 Tax=Bacillus sp. FJAT-27225 TaxID=1743144 RepID=UPI0020C76C8D|nr:response regulator transcription factor [Bacillus sp. FJAT-27225]
MLIVDDQELIRESLSIVLGGEEDIDIVGTCGNGRAAVDRVGYLAPHIVLMDINMPELDGVEATRLIKGEFPEVKVIMLTTFQELGTVRDALAAGAEGYLLKAVHPKDLAGGIRLVHHGGTLISQEVAKQLISEWVNQAVPPNGSEMGLLQGSNSLNVPGVGNGSRKPAAYALTERETQILHLLANGATNKEIARKLYLTEGTVKNYISSIYSKLNVHSRHKAIHKAKNEGLI